MHGAKVKVDELVDISYSWLQRLQEETDNDVELMKRKELVRTGWPRISKSLEFRLRPYWHVHSWWTTNGSIRHYYAHIIPKTGTLRNTSRRSRGQKVSTESQKCCILARYVQGNPEYSRQFWCLQRLKNTQAKCQMIPVMIPQQPWHSIGADLFYYGGKRFLLVLDAYWKAPFVSQVANTGAFALIKAIEKYFCWKWYSSKG